MKVLINLIPIKKGGGQQVASNFIAQSSKFEDIDFVYAVSKDTYVHKQLISLNIQDLIVISNNIFSRYLFTFWQLKRIVRIKKINLIYTLFGPGIHCKTVKSITGCAYSNIFFPEVDFWKDSSFKEAILHKIIDIYRKRSTLKSDFLIFENAAMQRRATSLFKFPENRTKLILPSVSQYDMSNSLSIDLEKRLEKIDNNHFIILLLTGWHKNKNINIIPHILNSLKKKGVNDIDFILTLSDKHPNSILLQQQARTFSVHNNIIFFDSIYPDEVPYLVERSDSIMLLSLLESFSNNIIEAWYFKKPLFISDEEWSRSICNDAAIYVKRDNPDHIADQILEYRNKPLPEKDLHIQALARILSYYPSPVEKVRIQIEYLKKIHHESYN